MLAGSARIQLLAEFDELAAAVSLLDARVDLAGEQIDPGFNRLSVPWRLYA